MSYSTSCFIKVASLLTVVIFATSCGDNSTGPTPNPPPEPQPGVISGSVNATDGSGGISGALLQLLESGTVLQETQSDTDGSFAFNSVESGQYKVDMTLPLGYQKSGPTSKMIQLTGDASIEFKGEPIHKETITVKSGEQDTVATSSGAFVAVNALDASSDLKVTISEVENGLLANGIGTKPVKIWIRPPGTSKSTNMSAVQMGAAKTNAANSVKITLGQKFAANSSVTWKFKVETDNGTVTLFADAQQAAGDKKKRYSDIFKHAFTIASSAAFEFTSLIFQIDNKCSDEYRQLNPVTVDHVGDNSKALIFIHGLQIDNGTCESFKNFKPVDLTDGDLNESFDPLIDKLLSRNDINKEFKFYTFQYPTNAGVIAAADALRRQMDEKNIKEPVIIAHSMGGLVGRVLIKNNNKNFVKGLITLGTPHEGSPMAKVAVNLNSYIDKLPDNIFNILFSLADVFVANMWPNTKGLQSLREDSKLINALEEEKGDPKKIFTIGGKLGGRSDIYFLGASSARYVAGYLIMKNLLDKKNNDGVVPLSSATPDWSGWQDALEGYDHSELKNGNNFNFNSPALIQDLAILLSLITKKEPVAPTINFMKASPNPSKMGETVNFSTDISGDKPFNCTWNFGNGATSTSCNATYTYQSTGSFNVLLKATNKGGSDTATITHKVEQSGVPGVIYVDDNATGNNDGSSWANAFNSLQDALTIAEQGQEIWVAEGAYYPDEGKKQTQDDRTASFHLKSGVELYGGFNGTENSRSMRSWKNNETILSGDIGQANFKEDNSFHVVIGNNINSNTIINGFTITSGNANDYPNEYGGGMFIQQGSPIIKNVIFLDNEAKEGGGGLLNDDSNPKIINVIFKNNGTNGIITGAGGAIFNNNSNPLIKDCKFINNSADEKGGGAIYNSDNSNPTIKMSEFKKNTGYQGGAIHNNENSNPIIKNCIFIDNKAEYGGAIFNEGNSPKIIDSKFFGNSADESGGAIYNDNSDTKIINSLFSGNTAYGGGAISSVHSKTQIINCTISNNSAEGSGGGGVNLNYGNSFIINTIIWGNTSSDDGSGQLDVFSYDEGLTISYSIVENGLPTEDGPIHDKGHIITSNPLFIDINGADNILGTGDDNLHLENSSSAINAGFNKALDLDGDGNFMDDILLDLDGNNRIQDGTVDIGPYEK